MAGIPLFIRDITMTNGFINVYKATYNLWFIDVYSLYLGYDR